MTVLTTIPNNASYKDIRDTLNSVLARILALENGVTPVPVPQPSLSLSSAVAKAEGDGGTTTFSYTLTLNRNGSTAAYPYAWAIAGSGSSPANAADFGGTLPSGNGTFAAGETSKTITVLVTGDSAVEPDEAFTLTVTAAGLNTVTATGTISNDDSAPANLSVTVLPPLYADEFDTPAGASPMQGRAGWLLPDTNSANNMEVKDGYAHQKAEYGPEVSALFGAELADFTATFGYSTTDGWEEYRTGFYLWWRDGGNFLRATITPTEHRLTIGGRLNGSDFYVGRVGGINYLPKGEITLTCRANKMRAMVDGRWRHFDDIYSYPSDVLDVSGAVAVGNRAGRAGFFTGTWIWPVLERIVVSSLPFYIDALDEFVGRDSLTATGGRAKITGTMVAGANPTAWVYRLLNYDTKAVVKDWAAMTEVVVSGQAMTGYVFLPTGGPYVVQGGYVDASDGKARIDSSRPCLSGIRGEIWGQSNALFRNNGIADEGTLRTKLPGAAIVPPGVPLNAWAMNTNAYDVTSVNETAKVMTTALGKPVGIGTQGVNAVSLSYLVPTGVAWGVLTDALAARRGIVEFVLWDQGEGDADGAFAPTGYAATFRNELLPGLRAATGNPDLLVFISPVGRFAETASNPVQTDQYREVLRQQYLSIVANEPKVRFSDFKLGALHTDSYHYAQSTYGYPEMCRRAGYTIAKALGANVADGRGAIPSSVSRSGAVVDVTLDLNGGSGLTGPTTRATGFVPAPTLQGALGFQVSADDFATTLAISAVELVGGKIRITLAANPGGAVKVRSHYGASFDDSALFYTTYADGRAPIPVAPIMTPLPAA